MDGRWKEDAGGRGTLKALRLAMLPAIARILIRSRRRMDQRPLETKESPSPDAMSLTRLRMRTPTEILYHPVAQGGGGRDLP